MLASPPQLLYGCAAVGYAYVAFVGDVCCKVRRLTGKYCCPWQSIVALDGPCH